VEVPNLENPGAFSFNMLITDNNHANLYTFGNCACLHPHPEGHWVVLKIGKMVIANMTTIISTWIAKPGACWPAWATWPI